MESVNRSVVINKSEVFGTVELSGAKNAALPIMVGAALCSKPVLLKNMPTEINDVKVMIGLLKEAGYYVDTNTEMKSISISRSCKNVINTCFSNEASKIRYSLLLLPLGVALQGKSEIPSPGGCNLGDRRYDIHLDTLQRMGCEVIDDGERIRCKSDGKLHGNDLLFHIATTSGSEAAILAAVLAKGKTIIRNANTRPEVIDLINFLNKMGANIKYKTRYIEVDGVTELSGGEYSILSDRHEGISFAILASMCRSELRIRNFSTKYVHDDVQLLRNIGVDIFEWGGDLYVSAKNKSLHCFSMSTGAYPAINSDMQPLFAALALTIEGESLITDTRFTGRFQYVDQFRCLGARIDNYENCAIIQGGNKLIGANVIATDLRAGASLTFLGAVAEGTTIIRNYYQTERGYEKIVDKLQRIGFDITEIEE